MAETSLSETSLAETSLAETSLAETSLNETAPGDYFFQGFALPPVTDGPILRRLVQLLREIRDSELREGYSWQSTYDGTCDLKPSAHQYSSVFMDFLFEQRLPERIRHITGYSDLVLGDIAVRQVLPEKTYLGWHRDTHAYSTLPAAGRTPPLHKVIFYPNLDGDESVQIRMVPRSHLRVPRSWRLDQLQSLVFGRKALASSNERVLLFNSMLLHHVPRKTGTKSSYRLIFNFCHRDQLSSFPRQKSIHEDYQRRMAEMSELAPRVNSGGNVDVPPLVSKSETGEIEQNSDVGLI